MGRYAVRRLLQMIPIFIGVTILLFTLFQKAPGDPLSGVMDPDMTIEERERLRDQMGLNDPTPVQYVRWVSGVVQGDLGESTFYKQPVSQVMGDYIWNSMRLALASLLFSVLVSIPIGIISATKQYSKFDYGSTVFALIGVSLPNFFFGYVLIKFFSAGFGLFPVSGMKTLGVNYTGFKTFFDSAWHMVLPVIVLGTASMASWMRQTRSAMLEVIRQDYIRTARSKGLGERVVIYKHALRNALIPIVTMLGFTLSGLFGGAIITEQVFSWPGIGPVALNAVYNRDYPLLMGYNVMISLLVLMGNLLADLLYGIVDPRVRLE